MKRIESIKNPKVKEWRKLHKRKDRDLTGTFFIEGFHLVEEGLKDKEMVNEIIITEEVSIPQHWKLDGINLTFVTTEIMKVISETETPQGIAAVCKQKLAVHPLNWSKTLMIDAIQDPGNLGTLIRTADAAGIDGVLLGDGTVDVYNGKTIRASQGSIFHIPIMKGAIGKWLPSFSERKVPVYGTALEGGEPFNKIKSSKDFALIVGNEGSGVQQDLLKNTAANLYIPIYGEAESLNVAIAAGILLYHLRE
ncbi:TrmH family RNA methyltransferase [Metabacillus arenae]|uniref:RNA methyltransferase n=1 Tax=Metabacillus arenae TaxID=2771434 RepID=A0A926NFC3_9BACI|nr:RNA methyltransferase [Metabacillus arenae]MBD1380065.1 RNA methyltransferase [Metabacillus arenae]